MKDYYYLLGVKKDASERTIKTAFKKLSHQLHPDKNLTDANKIDRFFNNYFRQIIEAREILLDKDLRSEYDKKYDEFFNRNDTSQNNNNYKDYEEKEEDFSGKDEKNDYSEDVNYNDFENKSKVRSFFSFLKGAAILIFIGALIIYVNYDGAESAKVNLTKTDKIESLNGIFLNWSIDQLYKTKGLPDSKDIHKHILYYGKLGVKFKDSLIISISYNPEVSGQNTPINEFSELPSEIYSGKNKFTGLSSKKLVSLIGIPSDTLYYGNSDKYYIYKDSNLFFKIRNDKIFSFGIRKI